jgi:hypothetical protein
VQAAIGIMLKRDLSVMPNDRAKVQPCREARAP